MNLEAIKERHRKATEAMANEESNRNYLPKSELRIVWAAKDMTVAGAVVIEDFLNHVYTDVSELIKSCEELK